MKRAERCACGSQDRTEPGNTTHTIGTMMTSEAGGYLCRVEVPGAKQHAGGIFGHDLASLRPVPKSLLMGSYPSVLPLGI